MTPTTTLILPGLGNSGPDHWQSHWERADATCTRVVQQEWNAPRCADWIETLDVAVRGAVRARARDIVFVAHSTSCALVAHWAGVAGAADLARVRGALLVAPSDPLGPHYPAGPTGFAPVPDRRLPFRSIVVASENDDYVTLELARRYAAAWGSELVNIGNAGHINAASGHGPWPEGLAMLNSLREARAHDDRTGGRTAG